jgi:hypothetical protein
LAGVGMKHERALKDVARETRAVEAVLQTRLPPEDRDAAFRARMSVRTDSAAARWRFLDRQADSLRIRLAEHEIEDSRLLAGERLAWRTYQSRRAKVVGWKQRHPKPPRWQFWKLAGWRRADDGLRKALARAQGRHLRAEAEVSPEAVSARQATERGYRTELHELLRQRSCLEPLPSDLAQARRDRREQVSAERKCRQNPREPAPTAPRTSAAPKSRRSRMGP